MAISLERGPVMRGPSRRKALNPRSMNKCPSRGCVDVVLFTAQGMKVPTGYMIYVVLVAAQHGRIAGRSQSEVYMRFALIVAD